MPLTHPWQGCGCVPRARTATEATLATCCRCSRACSSPAAYASACNEPAWISPAWLPSTTKSESPNPLQDTGVLLRLHRKIAVDIYILCALSTTCLLLLVSSLLAFRLGRRLRRAYLNALGKYPIISTQNS